MSLPKQSIQKLFRDNFPGDQGLYVAPHECEALVAELQQRFSGREWSESDEYNSGRHDGYLRTFTLEDPRSYMGNSFHFALDDESCLSIRSYIYGEPTPVASLDQIDAFVLDCRQRIERRKALEARQKKVRGFKRAAMEAQLKKLARAEKFNFATQFSTQRINIWILARDDEDAIHLHFSPKRFQEIAPRLPEMVRALRDMYTAGASFKVVSPHTLPWMEWIVYDDLAGDDEES